MSPPTNIYPTATPSKSSYGAGTRSSGTSSTPIGDATS